MTLPSDPRGLEPAPPATAHPCAICGWDRADQPVLCPRCVDRARADLLALPALVATIEDQIGELPGPGAERVSGSRERPLPGGAATLSYLGPSAEVRHAQTCPACSHWTAYGPNLACPDRDAQDGEPPAAARLVGWVRDVADGSGWLLPAVGRVVAGPAGLVRRTTAADIPALVAWLAVRHDWACRQDWADDYAAELADAHHAARRYAGVIPAPPQHMPGVYCSKPECDRQAIYRIPGEGYRCDPPAGGCGRRWTDDEYERWTRQAAWTAKKPA